MKTSLKGWHKACFYYENHEPSLPSFDGRLPEYQGNWVEEPSAVELPIVAAPANRLSDLKRHNLTSVYMATNWLARRVTPQKKQVHPGCEYSRLHDSTRETTDNIGISQLVKLLEEIF
jgi:hypothetical protein